MRDTQRTQARTPPGVGHPPGRTMIRSSGRPPARRAAACNPGDRSRVLVVHLKALEGAPMPTPPPLTRLRTPAVAAGLTLAATATLGLGPVGPAYAATAHNEQVALVNETNAQADAKSTINGTAQVSSADGRFVVFSTTAPLVPGDTNDVDDVYLRDTTDDITILVSRTGQTPGNDSSFEPTISKSGQFVA